jgi:hypothetical protein
MLEKISQTHCTFIFFLILTMMLDGSKQSMSILLDQMKEFRMLRLILYYQELFRNFKQIKKENLLIVKLNFSVCGMKYKLKK